MVLLPAELVAVSVTVYVPSVAYVCTGFESVEVPPSPNDHTHAVGELVEESRYCTESGTDPEVTLATKETAGTDAAFVTVTYPVLVRVSLPAEFVAIKVTV
jgi:hypothetical protein